MWSDVQVAQKKQYYGNFYGGPQAGASCPGIVVQVKTDAAVRWEGYPPSMAFTQK